MQDYKYGTLAFVPTGDLRSSVDRLRAEYDPHSAQISMAHITLTQPFAKAPINEDISLIQKIISSTKAFEITIGPATTSPNKRLIWLDVSPKDGVLNLRDRLHGSGLFRTDMPLTKGFIPHMTISEFAREPEEVVTISRLLNSIIKPRTVALSSIAWIIPNEEFTFQEMYSFQID